MSRARRRKKYKPIAKPSPTPRPDTPMHLVGWSVQTLAAEIGIEKGQAFRVLERGVREGSIVRLECGSKMLYARLGGGLIEEIPAPRHDPERARP
ncbi:hypothetical protein ACTU6V_12715 [Microbacterium sp. A204]|uniref:hypothetical protein n=1 Tax=Microbacterium sp. A204 TaxID=3457321 RepID=UPI003FD0FBB6